MQGVAGVRVGEWESSRSDAVRNLELGHPYRWHWPTERSPDHASPASSWAPNKNVFLRTGIELNYSKRELGLPFEIELHSTDGSGSRRP